MIKKVFSLVAITLLITGICSCNIDKGDTAFPAEVAWGAIETGKHNVVSGVIYTSPQYFINKDGIDYLAFCNHTGQSYILDDKDVDSLQIGNTFEIDCNRTITIECIEKDNDWISEHYGAINADGFTIEREPGRVVINDDYFFLHPIYCSYNDGHIEIDGATALTDDMFKWMLYSKRCNAADTFEVKGPVIVYNDPVWIPLASDCIIYICVDGERVDTVDSGSLLATLNEYCNIDKYETCYVSGILDDNGEVYELEIFTDETL